MRFYSTRNPGGEHTDLGKALLRGIAPDRGLYMPETIPRLDDAFFAEQRGRTMGETGTALLRPYLSDVPEDDARRLITDAFDFPVPLVPLGGPRGGNSSHLDDEIEVLELFHGPTLAFKDVAARFLARFLGFFREGQNTSVPLTILVATSGDTGGAVAQAFHGVPGTRVAVLYPRGQVSTLQEKQFTTLGDNVRALSVDGTFDDCQRLVKEAFADAELQERLDLTSANSISIGRLLPQMVYYVHAFSQTPQDSPPLLFCVPSGNFGNLTAGLIAHRMGLPAAGFVAATNVNDVVPEYLETSVYTPRPSRRTISNAMDVGDPSNFERIRHLYGEDVAALRRDLVGTRHDDEATRRTIREVHERTGYVLDPHTAVGYQGLREVLAARRARGATPCRGIVLSTAHPIKFREHVEPLIGRPIEVPERLRACLERPSDALPIVPELGELRSFLLDWR